MDSLNGMPIKRALPGIVDDPSVDSMLWAGLMCASGDVSSAQGIKACQTLGGQLWRSPAHIGEDSENSFSRDMAIGFLLYAASTNDRVMLRKWLDFVEINGGRACAKSDGRCKMSPLIYWHAEKILYGKQLPIVFWPFMVFAALTTPLGYQLHLVGCHLLLAWLYTGKRYKLIGRILHRRQPMNPFFMWLAGESSASIKEHVDRLEPEAIQSHATQWAWEREDSEQAWRDSMGWDFLFIRNLNDRKDS